MTGVAEKLRFYEMGSLVDQPRVLTIEGVAAWHDEQADYYEGGIQVEGANLAVTPPGKRAVRGQYRKLIDQYQREVAWHRNAARLIRSARLGAGCA